MPIYHLHVQIIGRSSGRSAVAAAAYRGGDKLTNERDGKTHDYTPRNAISAIAYRAGENLNEYDFTNKRGVVYSEIMLPENAPKHYTDRAKLWNDVELCEKRKDAQLAREIDIALPVELDREEQIKLMQEYIKENFVNNGMIADFAIHDKTDGNPHAHIMLTTRNVDKNGFKGKNRDWNKPEYLLKWRENWAVICNEKLQEKGLNERIDHRTLEAQGIDREPTIHVGRSEERAKKNRDIIARNEAKSAENTAENTAEYMHQLKKDYASLDKQTTELQRETAEARREMQTAQAKFKAMKERAEQLKDMKQRLDELKAERQKMGIFANKKGIDEQIKRLEKSIEISTSNFKRNYSVAPDEASAEMKRLEDTVKSKVHLTERLQEKLQPLTEEKAAVMLKYQKQMLLAEINPNGQKIYDNLEKLGSIERTRNASLLDVVTEHNFYEILKDLPPEQANKLIERKEREREQERSRSFSR